METRVVGGTGMACWTGCAVVGTSVAGQRTGRDGCSHWHSTWRRRRERERRGEERRNLGKCTIQSTDEVLLFRIQGLVSTRHRIAGGRVPSKEVCVTLRWRKREVFRTGEGVENPVGREDAEAPSPAAQQPSSPAQPGADQPARRAWEGRHGLSPPCNPPMRTVWRRFLSKPVQSRPRPLLGPGRTGITDREHDINHTNQPCQAGAALRLTRTPDQIN